MQHGAQAGYGNDKSSVVSLKNYGSTSVFGRGGRYARNHRYRVGVGRKKEVKNAGRIEN